MRLESIFSKIAGTLLLFGAVLGVISNILHLVIVIPYYSYWGNISIIVLACTAGVLAKKPRFLVGSIFSLAISVVDLFVPPYEPGYSFIMYAIWSYTRIGLIITGLIVLAVDGFKDADKKSGIVVVISAIMLGSRHFLSYFISSLLMSNGLQYYFAGIPINDITFEILMMIPLLVSFAYEGLVGIFFLVRRLEVASLVK